MRDGAPRTHELKLPPLPAPPRHGVAVRADVPRVAPLSAHYVALLRARSGRRHGDGVQVARPPRNLAQGHVLDVVVHAERQRGRRVRHDADVARAVCGVGDTEELRGCARRRRGLMAAAAYTTLLQRQLQERGEQRRPAGHESLHRRGRALLLLWLASGGGAKRQPWGDGEQQQHEHAQQRGQHHRAPAQPAVW